MSAAAGFESFFSQIHGKPAFPWQVRLAERVLDTGRWPSSLDLPTGTGKTAAIDIALFALAHRPDVFPRRVVLVVDRRVVVDQGAQRAHAIRRAMWDATDGPVAHVAARLRATFGGSAKEQPFNIAVLRGGMPRDEAWARRPDTPAVVLSTVDQVGSRLLFRGYGVSELMAPLHAGLLGNDCLYLLDEVQLSTAFAETLDALRRRWRGWHARGGGRSLPDRWMVMPMSATPIGQPHAHEPFTLDQEDRDHPVLSARVSVRKPTVLRMVRVSGDEEVRAAKFAEACATASEEFIRQGAVVSAVVVNRVATAREVFQGLRSKLRATVDVVLVTGRMRPLERARILGSARTAGSILSRISAGRQRESTARPIVVVATQSVEAGADFDFDALVTECASLDALRQRFGRLDRLGELGTSRAAILVRHDQVGERVDDPIYRGALAATWAWLDSMAQGAHVDFGIEQLPSPPPDQSASLNSPMVHAPVLLSAHVEAWAQTSPIPAPDPDVSLWLHGPGRGVPEVRVVWRADVRSEDLVVADPTNDWSEKVRAWQARLGVAPPSSLEALSLPIHAVRTWLQQVGVADVADVEAGRDVDEAAGDRVVSRSRRCLLVSGKGDVDVADASQIRPGATLVVPSSYGGITAGNWDPTSREPVSDMGDVAQLVHRGRVVLRLDPAVWASWSGTQDYSWGPTSARLATPPKPDPDATGSERRAEVGEWLASTVEGDGTWAKAIRDSILAGTPSRPRCRIVEIGDGLVAVIGTRRVALSHAVLEDDPVSDVGIDDDDSRSFTGDDVTLTKHLSDVASLAESFAQHLNLPDDVVRDLRAAGALHDVGKADPRFQQMLAGGSEVRVALQEALLAKSRGESRDRAARDEARRRSGYPRGYRHELASLAMVERRLGELGPVADPDLVLHLIASHHGWCRPFASASDPGPAFEVEMQVGEVPLSANAAHELARFDSGVAERYFRLTERYGWWGLAWLESVLRLADHRASEAHDGDVVQPTEVVRGVQR